MCRGMFKGDSGRHYRPSVDDVEWEDRASDEPGSGQIMTDEWCLRECFIVVYSSRCQFTLRGGHSALSWTVSLMHKDSRFLSGSGSFVSEHDGEWQPARPGRRATRGELKSQACGCPYRFSVLSIEIKGQSKSQG